MGEGSGDCEKSPCEGELVAELIAAKSLPTVRIGRSVRISAAPLQKWIEEHEDQGVSA